MRRESRQSHRHVFPKSAHVRAVPPEGVLCDRSSIPAPRARGACGPRRPCRPGLLRGLGAGGACRSRGSPLGRGLRPGRCDRAGRPRAGGSRLPVPRHLGGLRRPVVLPDPGRRQCHGLGTGLRIVVLPGLHRRHGYRLAAQRRLLVLPGSLRDHGQGVDPGGLLLVLPGFRHRCHGHRLAPDRLAVVLPGLHRCHGHRLAAQQRLLVLAGSLRGHGHGNRPDPGAVVRLHQQRGVDRLPQRLGPGRVDLHPLRRRRSHRRPCARS